jgi:hypothetical protein
MFISRMSRAAAEDSFAATRLMHRGSVAHGLQPWLSSVTATRLELVSQVCCHLIQGGEFCGDCYSVLKLVQPMPNTNLVQRCATTRLPESSNAPAKTSRLVPDSEQAYAQFAARPENAGIYARSKIFRRDDPADLAVIHYFRCGTYCLLARHCLRDPQSASPIRNCERSSWLTRSRPFRLPMVRSTSARLS